MGFDKLARPLANGRTLLETALRACEGYPLLVVASRELSMQPALREVLVTVNEHPERGMTYSLKLADAQIDENSKIAVIPADLPLLDGPLLRTVFESMGDADVCYPVRGGKTPGHPVLFSPKARKLLAGLPDGDTLRHIRDAKGLKRVTVAIEDDRPYLDIDLPDELQQFT